jgi:hypothetical protein
MSWVKRLSLLALAGVAGCYSFSGGGGLPSHIKTAYVEPAENQTTRFGISEVLTQQLLEAAQDRLGLMLAAEEQADAVIRVTVSRYSDQAVNFQAEEGVGANVFTRRITVTATVEILDIVNREYIYESSSVSGTGEYQPDVQTEDEGTALALENLVQKIVDGAQSQW